MMPRPASWSGGAEAILGEQERGAAETGAAGALPPELQKTLPYLPLPKAGESFAVVCSGNACQPPVRTVEELEAVLDRSLAG